MQSSETDNRSLRIHLNDLFITSQVCFKSFRQLFNIFLHLLFIRSYCFFYAIILSNITVQPKILMRSFRMIRPPTTLSESALWCNPELQPGILQRIYFHTHLQPHSYQQTICSLIDRKTIWRSHKGISLSHRKALRSWREATVTTCFDAQGSYWTSYRLYLVWRLCHVVGAFSRPD